MPEIEFNYKPHPAQCRLHSSPANEILFGGAAGPGKSMSLRWEAMYWMLRVPGLQVYLFRRTFPELEKNHIIKLLTEFPREMGSWHDKKARWTCPNGSMLHLCHCQNEKDVFNYQGAEIHLLLIDELTTFTEFIYDYLRGRVRCAMTLKAQYRHKIPGIVCASNPGGIGHQFCKRRWVDYSPPGVCVLAPKREGGMVRQYIPALLSDNPTLAESDPGYVSRLDALPEPYRTAFKEGNWNLFFGQAFSFNEHDHVIAPLPVPTTAAIYMTFDWGYGKPYSIGWWWEDEDGRLYRFVEDYGCAVGQIDVGLRLTDEQIAERVKVVEEAQGISKRRILRICDPTCFNKKPDYIGGGQGPSTAQVFARAGLILTPGDPSRIQKIRQFHSRLAVPKDGSKPMMLVYRGCEAFIRTIPILQSDKNNLEDIDTRLEDHPYDESALVAMARPMGGMKAAQQRSVDPGRWTK